ncbi:MAG: ATP cone domain-containing protein [Kiritimatiellia bacterium]|nr:ATP cone domain-containing protein [Kiritimatiellia bacterium]
MSLHRIIKRDGNLVAYDRERIVTAIFKAASSVNEGRREEAEQWARAVECQLEANYGGAVPTVEDVQDVVEDVLLRRGHPRVARAYIIYRHERALARTERNRTVEATDNVPYKKIYEVLRWNMDHDCETIEGINRWIAGGRFAELIAASDERYVQEVRQCAESVLERPDVRLVIIAGPSSSGKTTTTIKLSERLREAGRELVALNVDRYFFDLEQHPKDEFGDYDYETPHALDLPLINRHLSELIEGRSVKIPFYDFKTGRRTLDAEDMALAPHQVLLIDSLHGLFEGMTSGIPAERKFRLYIETLGQLRNDEGVFMRWADNRLLRRMIRDSWHRNHQPMQTLTHWHYVRASELKYIIPYIGTVDGLVNSALPYELPILKRHLFPFFPQAVEAFRADPKRQDAAVRAKRVLDWLTPLEVWPDDRVVAPDSLLREFIGGSAYAY